MSDPHPVTIQLAIDEVVIRRLMDKPCLIKLHPLNYKRMEKFFAMWATQGHIVESDENVELDRVWLERLEESSGQ